VFGGSASGGSLDGIGHGLDWNGRERIVL